MGEVAFYEQHISDEASKEPVLYCSENLSNFSLEDLEELTLDIAKQLDADDYDHLIRQKDLQFWLNSIQRVYGVVFSREKPKK